MSKPAPVEYPVHELIQNRWSPRAFSDKPITAEVLRSLFEAARWAPSSNNEQPWAFIVSTKDEPENYEKALGSLVEFNANWARKAPVLVIAVAELAFAKNNAPNRNAQYDVGAASLQLSLEATARGLVVSDGRVRSGNRQRGVRHSTRVGAHCCDGNRLSGRYIFFAGAVSN